MWRTGAAGAMAPAPEAAAAVDKRLAPAAAERDAGGLVVALRPRRERRADAEKAEGDCRMYRARAAKNRAASSVRIRRRMPKNDLGLNVSSSGDAVVSGSDDVIHAQRRSIRSRSAPQGLWRGQAVHSHRRASAASHEASPCDADSVAGVRGRRSTGARGRRPSRRRGASYILLSTSRQMSSQ